MSAPCAPVPSPTLADVRPYQVPRARAPVDLRLDGNEGAAPPEALLTALATLPASTLARYPDSTALIDELATRHDVTAAQVFLAAGADEVLDRVCRAVLCPGRELVVLTPGFEMTARYARLAGATVVEVPWPDDRFPLDEVRGALGARTTLVVLTSPNNPTGAVVPPAAVRDLVEAFPACLFVVDQAYGEFADDDAAATVTGRANVVLVRTLSKAWGLAGLRVGYAVGPAPLVEWLRAAGSPYPVSTLSLALALARLRTGRDEVRRFVARVRDERARLTATLSRLGATVVPSQANFVFARVPGGAAGALWLRDALAGLGIAVRVFPDRAGCDGAVRITCPGAERELERLQHGLASALAPEALLFDLESTGLVSCAQLARWRTRRPLGVVTALPTQQARAHLERLGVSACFDVVLGSDDAGGASTPVDAALARLGTRRAWMLAASAAGVAEARAARVVPLGVLPVGAAADDPLEDLLFHHGAARVLASSAPLEELLS